MALTVNVGLSRKLSRDYQSTGFSVNLEGEIHVPLDNPEAVIEAIREYYDLADEAIKDQIARTEHNRINANDVRATTPQPEPTRITHGNGRPQETPDEPQPQPARTEESATNKQVQFMLTIGKRHKLSVKALEDRIAEIIGRSCGVYDLTKREAGLVLDKMTSGNGNAR